MAETVKIVIDADDKASKEIKNVHSALGGIGNAVKGLALGGAAVGVAGIAALGSVLMDSVKGAMEAQAAQAQLAQTIKSTGGAANISADDVNKWAAALQDATAVEDDAIVSASSMLLTFTKINKDIFPRALELTLDMSRAFDQDLKSSVLQLGKALNDPIEGLGALQRIGVQFSDTQVSLIKSLMGENKELEALEKAANKARSALPDFRRDLDVAKLKLQEMQEAGKSSASQLLAQKNKVEELGDKIRTAENTIRDYNDAQKAANTGMSEAERLAKAQGIVMDELTKQVGGSAEAYGETFPGKLEKFNLKIDAVKDRIGTALIGPLSNLVDQVGPKVIEWADKFALWIETDGKKAIEDFAGWVKDDFVPALEDVGEFFREDFPDAVDTANEAADKFMEGQGGGFLTLWQEIAKAIQSAIDWYNRWSATTGSAGGGGSGAGGPNAPVYADPNKGWNHGQSEPMRGYNLPMGGGWAPVTINVNIAGNADPRTTRGAVLDALGLARARGMV